jgi:tetratricopeptide (TPR) repeat protein
MYACRIIGAFLMALCLLALVKASETIDKNQGSTVSGRIALQQAAALEKKAMKLLYSNGDYDEALIAYQEVLELKTRALDPDDAALAPTLIDIALCYRAKGDYTRAEEAYKRAVDVKGRALGHTHPDVGKTLKRYACLMRLAGRKDLADDLDTRATSILSGLHKGGPVTGTVVKGTRVSTPQPKYPKYARKQGLGGSVLVSVVIAEDGKIIDACATGGPPSLALASEGAALHALFTPTLLDGVPVKVSGAISYNFVAK